MQKNIQYMKEEGGLKKWFKEKWVDIGAKKKGGKFQECGRKSATSSKGSTQNASHLQRPIDDKVTKGICCC